MFNPTCFTGDTEVYTDNGLVCIEEIEVGDSVWAYNPETGETELKEVLNVWVKETDEILHVSTSDGETIDTTTNHPFYVEEKGWVAAGDLEVGDVLCTADGDEVEVTDLELEKLAEPITVYNLEVEDFHTYFVGEYGVLVHNNCFTKNSDGSYNIELHYKDGWTDAQKAAADKKVAALSNSTTIKIGKVNRSGTSASQRYKVAFGNDSVSSGFDVDHIIDLQLGGVDDVSNMNPLDSSVNRSLGTQIQHIIKQFPIGTIFNKFTIK